jgi:hypothetical protein
MDRAKRGGHHESSRSEGQEEDEESTAGKHQPIPSAAL